MSAHEELRKEIMAAIKKFEAATDHEFVMASIDLIEVTTMYDDGERMAKQLRIQTKALGRWIE